MKGKIIVQPVTRINEVSASSGSIFLYPNPVSSTDTVELTPFNSGKISIKVYNSAGKIIDNSVFSSAGNSAIASRSIDVSNLPNGIYFLIASDGKKQYEVKFIVMK